jgi:hypothetical protein
VPALVSYVRTFKRVQALQRLTGASGPINGWIGFILFIVFSPALHGYMQSGLNSAWRDQSSEAPGGEVVGQPA